MAHYSMDGKAGRNDGFLLFGLFQAESIFPAGQGDDDAGRVVIVGGLPRGSSLVVKRGCGTADEFIQRVFLGKRKGMPSRPDVDPEQVGQAGRAAHAADAFLGIRRQRDFSRFRITLRRPGSVYHNSQEHKAHGHHAERQEPVGRSER